MEYTQVREQSLRGQRQAPLNINPNQSVGVARVWHWGYLRCIKILIGTAMLLWASVGTVYAVGMAGSKHDLTTMSSGLSLCSYCHGSHDDSEGQVSQWGRTETTLTFTAYSSPTMDATMTQPGLMSLACLSCHDGVTAFDALHGSAGTAGNNMSTVFPGSSAIIGLDLSDDHPVGVDITRDISGIKAESTIENSGLRIYDSKVECASCHDVHGRDGHAYLLRLDPANGDLCSTCHNK